MHLDPSSVLVEPTAPAMAFSDQPVADDEMVLEADLLGSPAAQQLPPTATPPGWHAPLTPSRRRAVVQPHRLDPTEHCVLCYSYAQQPPRPRPGAAEGGQRWQGQRARLHYYLPENWSSSYKFTVFEDSYILSFVDPADALLPDAHQLHAAASSASAVPDAMSVRMMAGDDELPPPPPPARADAARGHLAGGGFHLARPLHGAHGSGVGEFELVWPVELDRALLEAVEAACDRVVPGAKRKPQTVGLQSVHLKLQKLGLVH